MEKFTFAVPCLFGLEGLVGEELRRMGLSEVRVEDRRAFFTGDFLDMARANLRLRMGERVMLLLGERPGLVTAESMSAYLTYGAHIGIPESKRTVISNIHRQGTTAVEAGAHIAELIKTMLEKKASGIELARGVGA